MSKLMKWSGSKCSQANEIIKYFPNEINTYYECFCGGGSIFLKLLESDIKIKKYIISDLNQELIGVYDLIKETPEILLETYNKHYNDFNSSDIQHRKDYFNKVKSHFNINKNPEDFYWLMRTVTNGMPRYNRSGIFNSSCHFSRPGMKPDEVKSLVHKYHKLFNEVDITFINGSYDDILTNVSKSDIIYMDPPYENTKGMYFNNFDSEKFISFINKLDTKWLLSYDGKVNTDDIEHISPKFIRREYIISGNSPFRRVVGNSKDSVVSESLYINY